MSDQVLEMMRVQILESVMDQVFEIALVIFAISMLGFCLGVCSGYFTGRALQKGKTNVAN